MHVLIFFILFPFLHRVQAHSAANKMVYSHPHPLTHSTCAHTLTLTTCTHTRSLHTHTSPQLIISLFLPFRSLSWLSPLFPLYPLFPLFPLSPLSPLSLCLTFQTSNNLARMFAQGVIRQPPGMVLTSFLILILTFHTLGYTHSHTHTLT